MNDTQLPPQRTDSGNAITSDGMAATLSAMRNAWRNDPPGLKQRRDDLKRLFNAIRDRQQLLIAAIREDFGNRSVHESMLADTMISLNEIRYVRPRLRRWMQPQHVPVDWKFWPGKAQILFQPLGVVGVMGAWNYPVQLTLVPLASAIGAGNHVMLKPSELAPATAAVIAGLLAEVFPPERVTTIQGGPEVAQAFSNLPFDHLFFTGSTQVGKKVMGAAANHLTPVTLELGGKSPAIIDGDYPLKSVAARVTAGKFLNAGQTCTAPDYLLVPRARTEALVSALTQSIAQAYPTLAGNPDLTHIINERQFDRLMALLQDAREKGAKIHYVGAEGTAPDRDRRVMPPTLILNVSDDMRIMREEIFGPLLPIREVATLDEAIDYINSRPRPLALYHFSRNRSRQGQVLSRTLSGGVSINDTNFHVAQEGLPFGGVGPSGMGHYHGRHGFLTFSKQKGVFYQSRFTALALLRAPYSKVADVMLKWLS